MQKSNVKEVIYTIILLTIGTFIGKYGVDYFFNNNSIDKNLLKAANEINNNCPFMIDKDTQLDNTIALPNNVFKYNFTIVSFSKEEIDVDRMKTELSKKILNTIKTSDDLKLFRENKVTMSYSYKDKSGSLLFSFDFKYDDYTQ